MEIVDYRITEGSEYCWPCFGKDAKPYSLSAWNGDHDGWSFNITFDTETQEVYVAEVCDYKHQRAYRLINPDYIKDYRKYAEKHNPEHIDQAWDAVNFVDLEEDDDFIQKSLAIRDNMDYDTSVSVPINLPNDTWFELMKQAHDQNITMNQLVGQILQEMIRTEESKNRNDDSDWDEIADNHWDGGCKEILSDIQDFKPVAKMKAKKKHKG